MATALKLKNDIKKLKAAINSKATPKTFVPKLKAQLERAEKELADVKSGGKPKRSSAPKTEKTLSALEKLIKRKKFSVYKGAGVDLKKDAGEGAMKTGKRISKGLKSNQWGDKSSNKGNVYYEYRPNRLDVKQPKKRQTYPKLEKGGYADGGQLESKYKVGDMVYSYQNKNEAAPISYVKFVSWDSQSGKSDKDKYIYKLKLADGYSNWINEESLSKSKMASGGYMAHGGKVEDELYVAELREGEWTVKDKKNPKGNYSLSSKKENAENLRQALIDNPSTLKYYRSNQYEKGGYMANGDKLESGVYRVGKPMKVSQNLYEQKIVEIFDNGDVATASDYGRKISDFKLQKYPMISKEKLDAQYKMVSGGSVKKGESVPYIIWVSKDGDKREFHGEYKSKKAADMAMNKLWDSGEYESMGNKPKSMYEKDGLYAKGGKLSAGHKIKYEDKDAKIVSQKGDMYFVEVMNYHPNGDSMFTVLRAEEIGKMADVSTIEAFKREYDRYGNLIKTKREYDRYGNLIQKKMDGGMMAAGGELHRTQEFKDGGSVFSEKELKEILDESLPHFFRGLNQIGLAMRYLEVKGQGGMKTALSNKLNIDGLNDSIEKIEQYVSK
jgi:hypothetical protein